MCELTAWAPLERAKDEGGNEGDSFCLALVLALLREELLLLPPPLFLLLLILILLLLLLLGIPLS